MGAGATLSARIPASWTLRDGGKADVRPSRSRARITDSSDSKSISASSSSGRPSIAAERAHRAGNLDARPDSAWLRPS